MKNFSRIRLARSLAINLVWPNQVFHHCAHGPQTWEWWHLFSISMVKASGVHPPSSGRHIWLYSRWGAILLGIYFDRRTPEQLGQVV